MTFEEWEMQIVIELEQKLEITGSDAQAIVEAQPFYLQNSWNKGMSATETAQFIIDNP